MQLPTFLVRAAVLFWRDPPPQLCWDLPEFRRGGGNFHLLQSLITVEVGLFHRPALTMGEAQAAGDIRKRGSNVVAKDSPLSNWPGPRDKGVR